MIKPSLFLFLAVTLFPLSTFCLSGANRQQELQHIISANEVPKGLAKSDWAQIRAAYEKGRHVATAVKGGHEAYNPGQQWMTRFDGRGFTAQPNAGGWHWGLELRSYGFEGSENISPASPVVKADGQRVSYRWASAVEEWYINDSRGLEHGFTVHERPHGDSTSALEFILTVRGDLRPVVTAHSQGVNFLDQSGTTVVTYDGLKVWDADGKPLVSSFQLVESGIKLRVDEAGARYPITIDPIAQQALIKAANPGIGDNFGYAVAISGDTVVVGATLEDGSGIGINPGVNEGALNAGAAYVFVRSSGVWTQQAYLKASNTGAEDNFGTSVAISGETLVVGADDEDGSGNQVNPPSDEAESAAGAAYVFVRSGGVWSQQAYLKASASGSNDDFGTSVAVSEDLIVVGAFSEDGSGTGVNPGFNNSLTDAGAAYVFSRTGTVWISEAYLKASNPDASDYFGESVAISGNTIVVGANSEDGNGSGVNPPDDDLATNAGAAYVFQKSGLVWSQQAYLKASNVDSSDYFGGAVSISDDTIVVGARYENGSGTGANPASNEGSLNSGAVYVFFRSGAVWTQQAYLKPSNPTLDYFFGGSVSVSGEALVVGGDGGFLVSRKEGIAYAFARAGSVWSEQAQLTQTPLPSLGDHFGYSVAISGDTGIVGAILKDSSEGAAYLFTGIGTSLPEIVVKRPGINLVDNTGVSTFGSINVGGTTDLVFNVKNTGLVNLNLTGLPNKVAVSGTDAALFSIITQPTSPILPNGSALFTVRFTPTSAGTRTAVLSIPSNDADENPFEINLSGTVANQEIAISQSSVEIASGGSKDFGSVNVGIVANLTFQISNSGGANLMLANLPKIIVSGPDAAMFSVVSQPSSPVSPSGSSPFVVRFSPTNGGAKSATLTIPNNDSDEANYLISITGNAIPQEIAVEQSSVDLADGDSKSIGGVVVNSSADFVFTIKNIGGGSLALNGNPRVTVGGTHSSMFSITNQPNGPIPSGVSTTFTVRFSPTASGLKTASLSIPNNDGNENPFDLVINGNGLDFTTDTDSDGLSDASEAQLQALGFDWQVNQASLVNSLYNNSNGAGLYTTSQVQALNVGTPLIQKNPTTGNFTLTIGVQKSTSLTQPFVDFPMGGPGTSTTLNGLGKLEFTFSAPGNAAFFRLKSE